MLVKTLSVKTDWLARPIVASGFHFINHKILYRKYTFVFTKNVNTAQLNNNWKINVQKFEILELWREEGENTWDLLISAQLRMCIHKNPQQLHALTCFKLVYQSLNYHTVTVLKVSKYRVVSGPYFSAFGVNTERYEVSLRIHSECGKIRTRNNSVFGHLFICVVCEWLPDLLLINQVRSLNLIQVTCKTCSIRKCFSPDLWLCISADIARASCFLCWCSLWKINHIFFLSVIFPPRAAVNRN